MKKVLKDILVLLLVISSAMLGTSYVSKAIEPIASEEYIVTVNGDSYTYRENTAQQIMTVNVSDSSGIVGSNASIKRKAAGFGWAVIEKSNKKIVSTSTKVTWRATVNFYNPVFADKTVVLDATYNF